MRCLRWMPLCVACVLTATPCLAGKPEAEASKAFRAEREDLYRIAKTSSGYRYFATAAPPCACPTMDFVVSCEANLEAKLEAEKKVRDAAEDVTCNPKAKCARVSPRVYVECQRPKAPEAP